MRKTQLGNHPIDQCHLFKAWKEGDRVEIIKTGFTGRVLSPRGTDPFVLWVKLDKEGGHYRPSIVACHSSDLREAA